jgi:hypothetical protein
VPSLSVLLTSVLLASNNPTRPHSFLSEGAAELTLAEGDYVRVHASGGIGWVIATLLPDGPPPPRGSNKGGEVEEDAADLEKQGLVPRGYLVRCEEYERGEES